MAQNQPFALRSVLESNKLNETNYAVAKMASHAIFQYNVLVIDDTHTTLGLI